jgi:hypothetical protein
MTDVNVSRPRVLPPRAGSAAGPPQRAATRLVPLDKACIIIPCNPVLEANVVPTLDTIVAAARDLVK